MKENVNEVHENVKDPGQFVADYILSHDVNHTYVFYPKFGWLMNGRLLDGIDLFKIEQCNVESCVYRPWKAKTTLAWLMACAFKDECVWYSLPNELVQKIARLCWGNELMKRCIKVFPYTVNPIARDVRTDIVIFVYDPKQDERACNTFHTNVVPFVTHTSVKIIVIIEQKEWYR
jgi:hypothetical protein